MQVSGAFLSRLSAAVLLEPAVSLLVLDVLRVYELLHRVDSAARTSREGLSAGADEEREGAAGADGGNVYGAGGAYGAHGDMMHPEAAQVSPQPMGAQATTKTLVVVSAQLELALDEACNIINRCRHSPAGLAGPSTADVKAAVDLLARARSGFCDAVITGGMLGQYVSCSLAQICAEQVGSLEPNSSIVLCGESGKARMFPKADKLSAPDSEDTQQWHQLLDAHPSCMGFAGDPTRRCRKDAKQVFVVWSTSHHGDAPLRSPVVLCVCSEHGAGVSAGRPGFLALRMGSMASQKYPPCNRSSPRVHELRCSKIGFPRSSCRIVLAMDWGQVAMCNTYGGKGWRQLLDQVQEEADDVYLCSAQVSIAAACPSCPCRVFADMRGKGQRVVRLVFTCERHRPRGEDWRLIYTAAQGATLDGQRAARRRALELYDGDRDGSGGSSPFSTGERVEEAAVCSIAGSGAA